MQNVSTNFQQNSEKSIRKINANVAVQWEVGEPYVDETDYLQELEMEKKVNEPIGGVHLAQFDLLFHNLTRRFSPGSSSDIADFLVRFRKARMKVGFNGELIPIGSGRTDPPDVNEGDRSVKLHLFDELEYIYKFKLPDGGKLYEDVRTDNYIWEILDKVYENKFFDLATMEEGETWTGGEVDENSRVGEQARKVTSVDGAEEKAYMDVEYDLSGFAQTDRFTAFVFVEDKSKFATLKIRLHSEVDTAFIDLDLLNIIENGWSQVDVTNELLGSEIGGDVPFFKIGTSEIEGDDIIPNVDFDWSDVVRVEMIVEAMPSETAYAIFDSFRMYYTDLYPRRYFDLGLQRIPIAEWSGNTALYEIKTACEAEGARFYADEEGGLRFENRQHYVINQEHRETVHEFFLDSLFEMKHPANEQGLINSVVVKLQPRRIVAEKEIFTYPYQSLAIPAGQTKSVWASFENPVPATEEGIVTPEATTDYTANSQADGSGSDKTSDIVASVNRFTGSAQIMLENTSGSTAYITMLKLRGTPAERGDAIFIRDEDSDSIEDYGQSPADSFRIDNKYMANEEYAASLASDLIAFYANPITRLEISGQAIPQLQIGDIVTVTDQWSLESFLMRIMGSKLQLSSEVGMKGDLSLRKVLESELVTFFTIGISEIGGNDPIST